jgi:hypothetical protein
MVAAATDYNGVDRPTEHLGMAVWLVATARAELRGPVFRPCGSPT